LLEARAEGSRVPNELADTAGPGPQDAITTGDETIGKPLYLHARTSDIFKHRQWLYLGPHPAPGDQWDPCQSIAASMPYDAWAFAPLRRGECHRHWPWH